ncbi:TPA: hypothetical protein SOL08_002075 [Clostridioides difficile]|nr:hypothetical protein [Clostridioides difficile]
MEVNDLGKKIIVFFKATLNLFLFFITEWMKFLVDMLKPVFLGFKYIYIKTIGKLIKWILEKEGIAEVIIIAITIFFLLVIFPPGLKLIMNKFENLLGSTAGEWLSFYGSYLGGILGGIATLMAVVITTNQTRIIQEENKKENQNINFQNGLTIMSIQNRSEGLTREIQNENNKLQLKNERKDFTNGIAENMAKYITGINRFFSVKYVRYTNENIKNDYSDTSKKNTNELEKDIEMDKYVPTEMYFLLKIKLKNINLASDLISKLDIVHNYSLNINEEKYRDIELKKIQEDISELINLTEKFITNYLLEEL